MELDIHPECLKLVNYSKEHGKTTQISGDFDALRKANLLRTEAFTGGLDTPFDGERTELFVPSKNVKDGIPIFLYKPHNLARDPAIYVHFHGGGMIFGTRLNSDPPCKAISRSASCLCVNVEYRLAPEHKFPAPFDDAVEVVNWVKKNKVQLGGSENSIVGIGGDSAGGCIAASVAHDVPLDFQVLVYPNLLKRLEYNTPSMQKYKDGPILSVERTRGMSKLSVPPGEEANPRLASILRARFDHLPPALILVAEHDILHDAGFMYAVKLKENGVPVNVHEFKGATHIFFGSAAYCPTLCAEAYKMISDFIQQRHDDKHMDK